MTSGSAFLLAARQCEIAELEELARTGELVDASGRLVHALQRERGITSVFLGSQGTRFAAQRVQQVQECVDAEQRLRAEFERLDTGLVRARNGARLFNRVAVVLHGLQGLPALRDRVARQAVSPAAAAAALTRVVAGLLALVFEAADGATDPAISRALVAMFNYMQGKEFAGQERACGAGAFAAGAIDAAGQQQWRHLVEAQQACFQVFADCAAVQALRADHLARDPLVLAEVERLRSLGCAGAPGPLDPQRSQRWHDGPTRRIEPMRGVEDVLAADLRGLGEARIGQARAGLHDERMLLQEFAAGAASWEGGTAAAAYGPHLERALVAMLQEQARRLQAMGDELEAVRTSLNERKVIERAKGLLMAHRHMTEEEAYRALREMAMSQKRRLAQVAEAVLSLAQVLP